MRLLFLSHYYPPETGAAANRISDLAERLASFGHQVTVLAPMPNYPEGRILKEYRGRIVMQERRHNVNVIRTWVLATRRGSIVWRLANYFSFVLTSVIGAYLKLKEQDIVVVASPPLFLGISGLLLKWHWKAKMVFNVSDLWPKSAVELGVIKNGRLLRLAEGLESILYKHSDLITGQTQGIISDIRQRTETPVILWTNGVDPSFILPVESRELARRQLGIGSEDFVVGYAGLHGLAQGLGTVLTAAEGISDHKDIKFAFFGDGPERKQLIQIAEQRNLKNVMFFPNQPKAKIPEIISSIDVSLVPLRRLELFKGALPSKMFEAMGSGVPVIVSIDGEAKELVDRARGGISIPPEDPEALVEAVLFLKNHPDQRKRMGASGKRFISAHYDRRVIAQNVETALSGLIEAGRPRATVATTT